MLAHTEQNATTLIVAIHRKKSPYTPNIQKYYSTCSLTPHLKSPPCKQTTPRSRQDLPGAQPSSQGASRSRSLSDEVTEEESPFLRQGGRAAEPAFSSYQNQVGPLRLILYLYMIVVMSTERARNHNAWKLLVSRVTQNDRVTVLIGD